MHKYHILFLWACLSVWVSLSPNRSLAQSLMGTTGLATIPTARMQTDGTISMGASFFDKKYQEYFEGTEDIGHAYINITFLPFLELAFRANRPLPYKYKGTSNDFYTVDRTPMVRLRAIHERKYLPAIVVGIHDFASTTNINTVHFNATYIVFSKQIKHFDLHFGYAPLIMKAKYYQLNGPFGGLAYSPHKAIQVQAEYDTKSINAGVQILLLKHLGINLATINFDSWAVGMNCKYIL